MNLAPSRSWTAAGSGLSSILIYIEAGCGCFAGEGSSGKILIRSFSEGSMTLSGLLAIDKRKGTLIWFLVPITIYMLVFFLYPVVYNIYIGFFNLKLGGVPEFAGLANYRTPAW